MHPTQTAPAPGAGFHPVLPDPLLPDAAKQMIVRLMLRQEPVRRIAELIEQNFQIKVGREQMLDCWFEQHPLPAQMEATEAQVTQTETAQTQTTQTGAGQDKESVQIPADEPQEPSISRADSDLAPGAATFSITLDSAPVGGGVCADQVPATQTGRRQNSKFSTVLTDEMKIFIVESLARYDTPANVAAAVHARFGIEIDRRRVFAYDPTGSRPPAQRWIELHAATRAQFLQEVAAIGIAQQAVRRQVEQNPFTERAARFLKQAARECGDFYERRACPWAAPSGSAEGGTVP